MTDATLFQKPLKTFTEQDILKDSDVWDWAIYQQVNRINTLSSTIWDADVSAKNKLLNMISSVDQLEFLCWEKIARENPLKVGYFAKKPKIFKDLDENPSQELEQLYRGSQMQQLQLKAKITEWLKCFEKYFGTMKKLKRSSFMAGEGELFESEYDDDDDKGKD